MSKTRHSATNPLYKDATQPLDVRVDDLLGRMTLEEKIFQMAGSAVVEWITEPDELRLLIKGKFQMRKALRLIDRGIGGFSEIVRYVEPAEAVELVNTLQKYALQKSRLGIPLLIMDEALHGCCAQKSTIFPQAIGWASTWDTELVYRMARSIGIETRSRGINQVLSPILDISHDPRWGRTEETLGEDPCLVSRLGVAYVKGVQGHPSGRYSVITTVKHFGVHNAPENGCNIGPTVASERMARDLYLKPFETVVKEARPLSVMSAYSEWDGVPASGNRWLLTDLLRQEWGFDGFVVSDYGSIAMMADRHAVAADKAEAGTKAVRAGVDLELPSMNCFNGLAAAVREGRFPLAFIDQSVRRILGAKFRLGLFENPYAEAATTKKMAGCAAHRKLALDVARKSIVLLKNTGILPLAKKGQAIAVIGPNAAAIRVGNYGSAGATVVTALDGIRRMAPKGSTVTYAKGCEIYGGEGTKGFSSAIEAARTADVAIVVVGEVSDWGAQNPNPVSGEGYDSDTCALGGHQLDLVKEIAKVQKKTVVVLYNGRPLALPWIKENIPAVIEAWFPGEEGGTALAEILFGLVNPSGRLPITVPASVGQLPVYYNAKPTARGFSKQPGTFDRAGRDYVFGSTEPLYPFGHGLSYTRYAYSNPVAFPKRIHAHASVTVSVKVRNAGRMAGEEVVQLYIRDILASVTRPVKELRKFCRVKLKPGQSKEVSFVLTPADLSFTGIDMRPTNEPGVFEVMVGGNSVDLKKTSFEVVGPGVRVPLDPEKGKKRLTVEQMGWH
jgi:beta-glucosidase